MSYIDKDTYAIIEAFLITLAKPTKNDLPVEDNLSTEEDSVGIHAAKDGAATSAVKTAGANLAAIKVATTAIAYAAAKNASA
ncbi:hypothetical protein L7F22_057069 [Adiantum nelumboides]|nr:hypothetical protein [Adiantum nelumboides]